MLSRNRMVSLLRVNHSRQCSGVSQKKNKYDSERDPSHKQNPKIAFTSYESKTKKNLSPLIMNHNLMGTRNNLNRVAKEINQITRRMVVNADCRNHGESHKSPVMTYEAMTNDIQSLMNTLEIPKTCFLGNGMGGRVGMLLALRQPALVDKLIVINSTPLNHMSIIQRVEKIKKAAQIMETCKDDIENAEGIVAKKSVADKILMPILKDSFDRGLFLTNLVTECSVNGGMWKLNFDALESSPLGVFPTSGEGVTFNGPCLFITGDKNDYLKERDIEEVTKLFPNAKFFRIADTGYWLHVERYKELLEIVLPFLSSD